MEVNYLKQYYNEIQNGNIIAGLELKTELQKLVKDLDNPILCQKVHSKICAFSCV